MKIKYKRLYEILNDEALVDELIEISSKSHSVPRYDWNTHYNKINLMKEELMWRMSK